MGVLDSLLKNPELLGDISKLAANNPEITKAAMKMFGSAGDSGGGLAEILSSLQSGGLGDVVSSWLGSGDNKAIDPHKLEQALGSDKISQFASHANVNSSEARNMLAGFLPQLVDKLSPDGKLPDAGGIERALSGLLGS